MAKKRQRKSGSRARRKPPVPGVVLNADGSRSLYLSDEAAALFKRQHQRFVEKFGREPGPNDPVFFDESASTPQVPSESVQEERWAELVEMIRKAGAPPEVMHAMRRTERIITSERWFVIPGIPTNEHHMLPAELEEWEAAMQEWRTWQERAEKAEAEGEHPAFVSAIRCSGLRAPRREDVESIRPGSVRASGGTADWLEAVNKWMVDHPEDHEKVAARLEEILVQSLKN